MARIATFFGFRAWDPIHQRWYKARYAAELETIKQRHGDQYELTGETEQRLVYDDGSDPPPNTRPR